MNRTKKFLMNSVSSGFLQIVTMLVGFVIPRVMLKYYGSEVNGLVSSIVQLIAYCRLVEAGLSNASIYALYKPLADNDNNAINGIVSASKKFYIQAGYIFAGLVLILAFVYPFTISTLVLSKIQIGSLVLVLGLTGILEFFTMAKYRVLLTADQKTYVISFASIVQIILNTSIVVILSIQQTNIVLLKFVATFAIFVRSIILMIYTRKKYSYINYNATPNKKALDKRWDALYLQILGAIHTGAPVLILTFVARDLKIVSVYAIYHMIIGGLNSILSIFTSGLSSSFGDVIARKEERVLKKSYSQFEFGYYMIISTIYAVAFITIMPFIAIYTKGVTDINYNIPLLGVLFVINGLLYNLKTPQGMLVISAGLYKETKWQTTIQGAIMVFGGIGLAIPFGIYGVLIASIASNLYRSIDLLIFIPKKVTKLPIYKTLIRWLMIAISVGIIQVPLFFIKITPVTYLQWIAYAIIIFIYAFVVVNLIFFVSDYKTYKNIINRFIKRRKNV
jgi:hypothetical protein